MTSAAWLARKHKQRWVSCTQYLEVLSKRKIHIFTANLGAVQNVSRMSEFLCGVNYAWTCWTLNITVTPANYICIQSAVPWLGLGSFGLGSQSLD